MTTRRNLIELAASPPVGLAILVNGQRFDLIGYEPHRRQDGQETALLVWQAECATCGEGFICRSPTNRWAGVRRCEKHRQPGRRVKARSVTTSANSSIMVGAERASATEFDREARPCSE